MRTLDPETWYLKTKAPQTKRTFFGTENLSAPEARARGSFLDAMQDFWMNCSAAGVKYMRESSLHPNVGRCVCVLAAALALGGAALVRGGGAGRGHLALLPPKHPARRVPFPAVALCPHAVVSIAALRSYARYLYSLDVNGTYSLKDMERNLMAFGALVTWSNPAVDVEFQEYLARVAHETNVTRVIMTLSPPCASVVRRCGWRAARVACSRLFAARVTPRGLCCVFNAQYQDEDQHNPVQKLDLAGQEFGLTLVVREDDEDAAFVRGPVDGVEVLLFDGSDYPLLEGGSSSLHLVPRSASAFLSLAVTAQFAPPALQRSDEWTISNGSVIVSFSPSLALTMEPGNFQRGCRPRRLHSRRVDRRGQAWCLTQCRRRAVRTLCGCVPHLLLPRPTDTVCAPDRLACLDKHKEKFTNFYPGDFADASLNEEASDSLSCGHCLPDCDRLLYSAAVSHVHYQHTNKMFPNYFLNGLTRANKTIIRIFYSSKDQHLYILETNRRWFEYVAHLASIWFCVVAVTSVSVAELLYHATVRWGFHYRRRLRLERIRNKRTTPSVD